MTTTMAILSAILLTAVSAQAATPEQKCEGGKNSAAGKLAACLHKAQQKFVAGGETDTVKYDESVLVCGEKYSDKWQKSDAAGACAGGEAEIQDFIDACVMSVVEALGGGTLGIDPATCNTALDDCNEDLATCESSAICGDGVVEDWEQCDDGNENDLDACRSNCQAPRCGDGVASTSEACDTGGNTASCNIDCTVASCGDGRVNTSAGEQCDAGAGSNGDGCSNLCHVETCGNGILDVAIGEVCDDANVNDLDGCRNNCQTPRCGDGVASASEVCDAGSDTASCDLDCTTAVCGDGRVNALAGEQCDNGGGSGDGCSNACHIETCGNGILDTATGEVCDDGNVNDTDGCRNSCQTPRCGDGLASASEVCDAGSDTASCDLDCTTAVCGDGRVNAVAGEECDNGGGSGDGCSNACHIETCGNGILDTATGEVCDDANVNDLDGCRNNCQTPRCGDGVASAFEACDAGGNTASCDFDCTVPQCGGDGVVNQAAGEQCDDNNSIAGDGCNQCRLEICGNGLIEPGEECDDAPPVENGDGCDVACAEEPGWSCFGEPSVCALD